ncbi:MAG: hypothetical protein E7L09_05715 [Enterobacteriaceae bacterium]|nr:hypothetical protein [Enterobacteriaceae bacterium]
MENEDKIEWLEILGSAMFGSHWKSALASHLGINDRSIRQWANGERTIPDSIIRGLISQAHDRAALIAKTADRVAQEALDGPEYERVIFQSGLKLAEIRRELYTDKRDWFDVDGKLYALNENGSVIDIHGYENDCDGLSILPIGITINDLKDAKQRYISENADYD